MYHNRFPKRKINPRQTANPVSLSSFLYSTKIVAKGFKNNLETTDVYQVLPSFRSQTLGDRLEEKWQKKNQNPSITYSLWQSFRVQIVILGLLLLIWRTVMTIWSPKALSKLISYFSGDETVSTKRDATFWACLVIILHFTNLFVTKNVGLLLTYLGIQMKAAVSSLLYRKSLKLSPEAMSGLTAGKIITVVTKDTDSFEGFVHHVVNIVAALVQTSLVCYLIYDRIGVASLTGIAFFLIVVPVQVFIGVKAYGYRLKCNKKTDERLEVIRQVLSAIRVIKMYTWEKFFEEKIDKTRKNELTKLHKLFYTKVWITLIGSLCSKIAFFIFIMTHVWMGNSVTAETVYYILSMCTDLEESMVTQIPFSFSNVATVWATLKRIQGVLDADELTIEKNPAVDESKEAQIVFEKVSARIHQIPIFEDVTLTITKGLTTVLGSTGSGKTAFLKTILNDFHVFGEVKVNGRVSYASQEPWIFPGTIKDNILFGDEYNEQRYRKILEVCCLVYDLKQLPGGDGTVAGDRGSNLSKGQQARVNLARAVYRESDVYLLDDCLAPVDGRVSDAIFTKCIVEYLANRVCVFVTQDSKYAQCGNKVIEISSGSVRIAEKSAIQSKFTAEESTEYGGQRNEAVSDIYHEPKKSGRVPLKYYSKYLKHGGGILIFGLIVALFLITQSTSSVSEKFLSQWVTLEENLTISNQSAESRQKLGLYASTSMASIILTLIKSFAFFIFTRRACISIHKAMVTNVINSKIEFFDRTFLGNILTRFTKDCVTIDETFPFTVMDCLSMIFTAFGGIILLTTVDYSLLVQSVLLILTVCVLKQFFQPTGRNLERLHVIVRSSVYGHLNSTLEGLTTIRAYKAQKLVTNEFDKHQDVVISALCMVVTNFAALAFFLGFVCTIFITSIVVQLLVLRWDVTVGDAGLVITQATTITGIITAAIINVADCENLMISTERMLEFTELEEEDKGGQVLREWPKSAPLSFNDVSLRYNSEEILSNISFVVNPDEKLGIVGRTGAGKSSIISALFRMYQISGSITIGDLNIQDVSLNWLRSNTAVITQDPYVFSGTVRENLDPMKLFEDAEIWKVLEELKLKNAMGDLEKKIEGSSFSTGEKQLLCLARVILRKANIVVLDEATANVDEQTEAFINETIQTQFSGCMVIIVSHKVASLKNCQKVLILQNGRISGIQEHVNFLENRNSLNKFFS